MLGCLYSNYSTPWYVVDLVWLALFGKVLLHLYNPLLFFGWWDVGCCTNTHCCFLYSCPTLSQSISTFLLFICLFFVCSWVPLWCMILHNPASSIWAILLFYCKHLWKLWAAQSILLSWKKEVRAFPSNLPLTAPVVYRWVTLPFHTNNSQRPPSVYMCSQPCAGSQRDEACRGTYCVRDRLRPWEMGRAWQDSLTPGALRGRSVT